MHRHVLQCEVFNSTSAKGSDLHVFYSKEGAVLPREESDPFTERVTPLQGPPLLPSRSQFLSAGDPHKSNRYQREVLSPLTSCAAHKRKRGHTNAHRHTFSFSHTHTQTHPNTHTQTHTRAHTHAHTHRHTHTHARARAEPRHLKSGADLICGGPPRDGRTRRPGFYFCWVELG